MKVTIYILSYVIMIKDEVSSKRRSMLFYVQKLTNHQPMFNETYWKLKIQKQSTVK